jgi:predicted AlkP superfamily pyrophosphatase or phosphodiesterase
MIAEALRDAHPRLRVYRRDEIPEHFRLAGNPRLPPIFGTPDVGWEVFTRARFAEIKDDMSRGGHGQDPADPRMHGIFIAAGPAFEKGLTIDRFESVNLYHLMAAILGLEPAPNDGDPDALVHIMK